MNLPGSSYNWLKITSRFGLKRRGNRQTTFMYEGGVMETSVCLLLFSGPSGNIRVDYRRPSEAAI